jgi:ABC-type nitrate/sulfonate/bicarbonate transport system substrate-binding protein
LRPFMPLILLLALSLTVPVSAATTSVDPKADLSRHPIYSAYDFGSDPDVINVGTQPLFVPVGVIGEVMRRDRILRSSLKKIGLEIRFHPFLKGDDINFFLKRGKIDAVMAGDMPTITTASSYDIVVSALAQQGFSSIVSRGHFTLVGLKGKRIGYPPVSIAHYALLAALAAAGLKETDVHMVPMAINEMVDALATDRIDAFAAWEPIPSIALKNVTNAASIYRYLNSSYLYFSRSLADRHPEAAALIMASMIRAFSWMKSHEEHLRLASQWTLEASKQLQGRSVALSAEKIAELTIRDILSIASSPIIPERDMKDGGSLRKKFDFLKAQGKIPHDASWEKVLKSFDSGGISAVLANPKKYRINSFDYDMGSVRQ